MGDKVSIENPETKKTGFMLSNIVKRKILEAYQHSKNIHLESNISDTKAENSKSINNDSKNN